MSIKANKGITLIALVITIIVLLILAGVTINMVLDDNGIIAQAKQVQEAQEEAKLKEEVEIIKADAIVQYHSEKKDLTQSELLDIIQEKYEGSTKNDNIVTIADGKYNIIVDEKLNITVQKNEKDNEEVIEYTITLDKTEIVKEEMSVEVTEEITAIIEPTVEGLVWESSNEDIAVINGEGNTRTITIKPLKGEAIIKISYGEVSAECKITVTIEHSEGMVPVIEATGNFANNKNIEEVREGNIPIPTGFSYVKGDKDGGVVIIDGYGNEFVWVPVSNPDTFTTLTKGWSNGIEQSFVGTEPKVLSSTSYDGNAKNILAILEVDKYSDLSTQFTKEYNDMVESVKAYGGFYVGCYETSWTGTKVASVGNVVPMKASTDLGSIWITSRSDNKASWYGLYAKQKELYNKESDSVVSGMIYGCQWDAIMNWMKDIPNNDPSITEDTNKFYIKNSTGMGVYASDAGPLVTGQYKVNNIYDLAGNYYEWTQEAYLTDYRVVRGGLYNDRGSSYPASRRGINYPTDTTNGSNSSRLQLYIK